MDLPVFSHYHCSKGGVLCVSVHNIKPLSKSFSPLVFISHQQQQLSSAMMRGVGKKATQNSSWVVKAPSGPPPTRPQQQPLSTEPTFSSSPDLQFGAVQMHRTSASSPELQFGTVQMHRPSPPPPGQQHTVRRQTFSSSPEFQSSSSSGFIQMHRTAAPPGRWQHHQTYSSSPELQSSPSSSETVQMQRTRAPPTGWRHHHQMASTPPCTQLTWTPSPELKFTGGSSSSWPSQSSTPEFPASAPPGHQKSALSGSPRGPFHPSKSAPPAKKEYVKAPPPPKPPTPMPNKSPTPDYSAFQTISNGEIKIQYQILDGESKFEFPPDKASTCPPRSYYPGLYKYEHEKEWRKATFVTFDNLETAERIFYSGKKVKDFRFILKPVLCGFDSIIKKDVVGFDSYDGLLGKRNRAISEWLRTPLKGLGARVPRNAIQDYIKNILRAIQAMDDVDASTTFLDLQCAFFFVGYDLKLMATSYKKYENEADRAAAIRRMLESFKTALALYFLCSSDKWPERDSFFEAFTVKIANEKDRLQMLIEHPFLNPEVKSVYRVFHDVDHALRTKEYENQGMEVLCFKINSGRFDEHIMENGSWDRKDKGTGKTLMSPSFQHVFNFADGFHHKTHDAREFFRFNRNVYDHLYDKDNFMKFKSMVTEIETLWPQITHRIHETKY